MRVGAFRDHEGKRPLPKPRTPGAIHRLACEAAVLRDRWHEAGVWPWVRADKAEGDVRDRLSLVLHIKDHRAWLAARRPYDAWLQESR